MEDEIDLDALLADTPSVPRTIVDDWLDPITEDAPGGDDLEYDNDFLELTQAAAGKPETQFSAAVPPEWRTVRTQAEALLKRTRDVRLAIYWTRAKLNLDGARTLPESLRLLEGLFDGMWDHVHPKPDPDDNDPYARANAVSELVSPDSVLGDLRAAHFIRSRSVGELLGRSLEIARGEIAPREGENALEPENIQKMLAAAVLEDPSFRTFPSETLQRLESLQSVLNDKLGYSVAPDLKPIQRLFKSLESWLPALKPKEEDDLDSLSEDHDLDLGEDASDGESSADVNEAPRSPGKRKGQGISSVESREDAVKAIEQICAYLERTEPSNPAQLLLRRATQLINMNFIELLQEFAPDSVGEVTKWIGGGKKENGYDE